MKSESNPNATSVEGAVNKLVSEKLDKIIDGAKNASEAIGNDDKPIANVDSGVGAKGESDNLIKGIKGIVEVVLQGIKGNAEAGDGKKAEDGSADRFANAGEAGKLFGNSGGGNIDSAPNAKKAAADASKAVGSIIGADILKAIVKDGKATATNAAKASAKDATIAGAIAVRAMTKDGKFPGVSSGASADDSVYQEGVKIVAVSAVAKALDTLTISIRTIMDEGLKEVKQAMKINPEATPVTTEAGTATK